MLFEHWKERIINDKINACNTLFWENGKKQAKAMLRRLRYANTAVKK